MFRCRRRRLKIPGKKKIVNYRNDKLKKKKSRQLFNFIYCRRDFQFQKPYIPFSPKIYKRRKIYT